MFIANSYQAPTPFPLLLSTFLLSCRNYSHTEKTRSIAISCTAVPVNAKFFKSLLKLHRPVTGQFHKSGSDRGLVVADGSYQHLSTHPSGGYRQIWADKLNAPLLGLVIIRLVISSLCQASDYQRSPLVFNKS